MARLHVYVCDNCGQRAENPARVTVNRDGFDICSVCCDGDIDLSSITIEQWPRFIARGAVVRYLRKGRDE